MRYRKKPVDIEAFRLTDDPDRIAPGWFTWAVEDGKVCIDRSLLDGHMHVYGCTIMTPGGRIHAKVGYYIIRGVYGELYPCDPRIFCMTHEKVG